MRLQCCHLCLATVLLVLLGCTGCHGNNDAKRLYDDLLRNGGYNRLIRPVSNSSEVLKVKLGLKLAQLIDVVSGAGEGEWDPGGGGVTCARPPLKSEKLSFYH